MEFRDAIDCTGAPIEGSEQYRMIFTRDELAVAKEALATAITAGLQSGSYEFTDAKVLYELALDVNIGSGHRKIVPRTARLFASVLDAVGSSLNDERPALASKMANELREEAAIREFAGDVDTFPEEL